MSQQWIMDIVGLGLGFDVPHIVKALQATKYASKEAAINYLLNPPEQLDVNSKVGASQINELKQRIEKLELDGTKLVVDNVLIEKALKKNKTAEDALAWLIEQYPDRVTSVDAHMANNNNNNDKSNKSISDIKASNIGIENAKDVEATKEMLKREAKRKAMQKKKDEEYRKKIIEEQIKLEKERERKAEIHRKKIEKQKKIIENKKKAKEKDRKTKLMEWHKRHEEYDKKDNMRKKEMEKNRLASENLISNPQSAIKFIYERIGNEHGRECLLFIKKILNKIISNPKEKKYRELNCNNRKVQQNIITPIGCLKFLKFCGFEKIEKKDKIDVLKIEKHLILTDKRLNLKDLKNAVKMIENATKLPDTPVKPAIIKAKTDKNINNEQIYCALMYIKELLKNITISPTSENLRIIEIDDSVFKTRVGQFPIFVRLLKDLDWKFLKEKRQFRCYNNNLTKYKFAILDIDNNVNKIFIETPIYKGYHTLRNANSGNVNKLNEFHKFCNLIIKSMNKIIEEPLNMKYQSISIEKLKTKFKDVTGIISLLKLVGFHEIEKLPKNEKMVGVDGEKFSKKLSYCFDTKDFGLFKLRKQMLEACLQLS